MTANESGTGYLRVRVTSAGGSLPVEGAIVKIYNYNEEGDDEAGDLIYSLRTGSGGLTESVELSAPPVSESFEPGGAVPYSLYNISVTYSGYYPVEGVGVPIFDGIVAVQPVNLMPISEAESIAGAENGRIMLYETPIVHSLEDGGRENIYEIAERDEKKDDLPSGEELYTDRARMRNEGIPEAPNYEYRINTDEGGGRR